MHEKSENVFLTKTTKGACLLFVTRVRLMEWLLPDRRVCICNVKKSIFKSVVVVSLLNIIEFFATLYELALCFVELAEAEIPS